MVAFQQLNPARIFRKIAGESYQSEVLNLFSPSLQRQVRVDLLFPSGAAQQPMPLLVLNDGQDADAVRVKSSVETLWHKNTITPLLVAAVHAGERLKEYGVATTPDFAGRGNRAASYTHFLIAELMPYLNSRFKIDAPQSAFAGFSLGGLSAFDIAWHHPTLFGKVGAFSGSFWWRSLDSASKAFDEQKHRIVHQLVRASETKPNLKFWLQTGTRDEAMDRNGNGIIDSIDDTLDLVTELTHKGYRPYHDIVYHEIKDGEHNQHTWAKAMPVFLQWAFGR